MKHFLSLLLAAAIAGTVSAQAPQTPIEGTPKAAKSALTLVKIRQLDAMIQLLPLNLKKKQIEKILDAQDKIRARAMRLRMQEDDDLESIDNKVDTALKAALDKGTYPAKELLGEIAQLTKKVGIRRQLSDTDLSELFYALTRDVFEAGQLTVMEKSLDIAALSPGTDVSKMERLDKIKFFMRRVFIDVNAYDVLREMVKTAS